MQKKAVLAAVVCASAVLGGCAVSPYDGYTKPTLPKPVAAVYSEFSMKLRLLAARDSTKPAEECTGRDCFDQRVARLGPKVFEATLQEFPDFGCSVREVRFVIADKAEPGTLSTALGRVVVFRAVENIAPTDAALSFILAREVGHVVAQHHEKNATFGLLVSGLTHLLLPVTTIAKSITDFVGPTAGATTAATATVAVNGAVTATSMVGSNVAVEVHKPTQQEEADDVALRVLARMGFEPKEVAQAFGKAEPKPANDWMAALNESVAALARAPVRDPELVRAAHVNQPEPPCRFEDAPQPLILGMLR
jgi:hypothetical protein